MKTFEYMIDVSRVNAQCVHDLNHDADPRKSDSWDFAEKLGLQLVLPFTLDET